MPTVFPKFFSKQSDLFPLLSGVCVENSQLFFNGNLHHGI